MSGTKSFRGSQSFVWDINKPLGQGATSIVYMGRNKKTGDEVAVKVFNPMSHQRPMAVQLREFEVMEKLKHENVVKMIAVEEEVPSGSKVLVMEFCTHGTLYNLLENPENNYGLAEEEYINVLQQVTAGVKHLRDSDIVHRDIKPGNILRSVMPDGRSVYKLTDFGAARELQEEEEFFSLYGTDEYLHPDMYEKAVLRRPRGQQFGSYVDLWSLGVTFYHAAAGNLPFRPFGGRKNRETMHQITTQKEHGVISGVQYKEGGSVEWSRDLPPTCRLSRGLKDLVTPMLATLLERDQAKTASFDEFFHTVKNITTRMPYHVFCPSSFSLLTIYAGPNDDISRIRQLITDQTEIPGGAQLLLHDGKVVASESRERISTLVPFETKRNPIFLFNKLPEYKGFRKPSVGVFTEIPIATDVNQDYPLSKRCLAVLHNMRNAVRTLKSSTEHMHTAVKMYSDYVHLKCSETERTLMFINKACVDATAFKEQVFQLVAVEGQLLRLLDQNVQAPLTVGANTLQTLHQTGNRECSQLSNQIHSKLEKSKITLKDIKNSISQDSSWDQTIGCVPADKCSEKMDVLISRLHKIMSSFKEDRHKRNLNNNEEQIHRVDKNKMKTLTVTAKTLLEDQCTKKAELLFKAFKHFYGKNVQINDTVERLSSELTEISDQHSRLMDKLKASSKQCINQANSTVIEVGRATETRENNRRVHTETYQSQSEKLGNAFGLLDGWGRTFSQLRDFIGQNTDLVRRMAEMENDSVTACEGEEPKSWVMIDDLGTKVDNQSQPSDTPYVNDG